MFYLAHVFFIDTSYGSCMQNVFVCVFCSPSSKGILSGHADGSIVRFFLEDEGTGETQVSNNDDEYNVLKVSRRCA